MTFIASVIAKDGIAIIADSLVSSMDRVINQKDWKKFLEEKTKGVKDGEDFKLTEEEITKLFKRKPSYTKDYENKLFEYDAFTIITTAGAAYINEKRMVKLIADIKKKNLLKKGKRSFNAQGIDNKVKDIGSCLEYEIKEHLKKYHVINHATTFIISNYNKSQEVSTIYKIIVHPNNSKILGDEKAQFVTINKEKDVVICDGQYGVAHRILYGGMLDSIKVLSNSIDSIKKELEAIGVKEGDKEMLPNDFFKNFHSQKINDIFKEQVEEAYLFQLKNLSLQQASDLAYLLLMVERDFQAYTKEIPTVGGVIKLATITQDGINFILGKNIIKPTRHL